MAIPHAKPGEVVDVRPLATKLVESRTETLIKTDTLEVIRLVLPAGKEIPTHNVPGEITVQCLEGKARFAAHGAQHELSAGQLVFLAGSAPHAVEAVEDASLLVTILLRPKQA